jgi:hypothetical protein
MEGGIVRVGLGNRGIKEYGVVYRSDTEKRSGRRSGIGRFWKSARGLCGDSIF